MNGVALVVLVGLLGVSVSTAGLVESIGAVPCVPQSAVAAGVSSRLACTEAITLRLSERGSSALATAHAIRRALDGAHTCVSSVGFSWETWRQMCGDAVNLMPPGFPQRWAGVEGMRTTGGDVFVHLRCAERDHLYHAVVAVEREASAAGATMEHTHGWRDGSAGRNNDLTGFEDGVQNCPATAVSREVFLPANSASACGSFLLAQTWRHNFTLWQSLPVAEQEAVFGRSKYTSARLPHPAPNAHSVKVSQSALGFDVLRLSSPYGQDQNNAGLIFLAYSKSGDRLVTMCESMVRGAPLGRDRLMGVSHCFASNLYYVPSANVLDRLLLPLILGK